MLAVAGKRDHSLSIFAMLAAEFVFIHDAGTTGVGALLGSRHDYYLHSLSWMLGRQRTGKHTADFMERSNEVASLPLGYSSGW
jgi:hypothetical protein